MFNPYRQYMYSYPHKTAYRPLSGVMLEDYISAMAGGGRSLYLHIPFCQAKCGFCNLFSVTGQGEEEIGRYLEAVERQLGQYRDILAAVRTSFSDFTIGGGTPLLLDTAQLDQVFSMVSRYLSFDRERTILIETAPNQTNREKLRLLKQAGVTRVSMGIQSFSDEELRTLRRCHSARRAREAMELLASFDFSCVNVDFIYGIPGQTADSLLASLKEVLAFEPDEIFLYPLYVKHGAGLEQELQKGMVLCPEQAFCQYQEGAAFLRSEGFRQDSMRRFVRQRGKEETNRCFSDCGFSGSLALGCGGRSYLGPLHFCTPYSIRRQDSLEEIRQFEETKDFSQIRHGILLDEEEQKRRYVIRHLLIAPGIDLDRYQHHFGTSLLADFPLLEEWIKDGYLSCVHHTVNLYVPTNRRTTMHESLQGAFGLPELMPPVRRQTFMVTLTDAGLGLSDYLGPQLISPEIGRRMEEWEVEHGQNYDPLPRSAEKL